MFGWLRRTPKLPPEFHTQPGADIGIVSLGGCHAAVREAVDHLRAAGIVADYMRVKAFPLRTFSATDAVQEPCCCGW